MNKDQTLVLKGIAIIMMLLIHLDVSQCTTGGTDLYIWSHIQRLCVPVPLFLLGGGYGLYIVNNQQDTRRFKRILRLLCSYWLVIALAVPLTFLFNHPLDFSFQSIVYNITTWQAGWNGTCWFIFPYSVLSLSAVYLFRWTKSVNPWIVVATTFFIHIVCLFLWSRLGVQYEKTPPALHNLLCLHMLFCFMFGAMAAREGWLQSVQKFFDGKILQLCSIAAIIIVAKLCLHTTAFNGLFAIGVMILVVCLSKGDNISIRGLRFLGRHSMNIWLVHAWIMIFIPNVIHCIPNPAASLTIWFAVSIPIAVILSIIERRIFMFL